MTTRPLPANVTEIPVPALQSADTYDQTAGDASDSEMMFRDLADATTGADEEAILRRIAHQARCCDGIGRALLRERIVSALKARGCSSPATIADAVLGTVSTAPDHRGGITAIVSDPDPWPLRVDGAELLDEIATVLLRYVVLPDGAADALALWVVHTHCYDRHMITPRLLIASPEKRCGKTVLLDILNSLCSRSILAANLSAAVMYRVIEAVRPTLLVDEADTFLPDAEELRGIINAGHRNGGTVLRCDGDDHEPRAFPCFGPVALAGIGRVQDTITDRSVIIPMRRRARGEYVESFGEDCKESLRELARRCARWAQDNRDSLALRPDVPNELNDRARDNWRVLLAIADHALGRWPESARAAAVTLTSENDDESTRVQLLMDIREVFEGHGVERLPSADILSTLHAMEHRSWGDFSHGKPMTPQALGRQLKPFNILAEKWRTVGGYARGYSSAAFQDAWSRYLG